MTLSAGTRLGPYEILSPLGAGGMGQVWKARDTRLNRAVAIKQMRTRHTARFAQEARALAAVNHPHICQIYDVGPDYLVLEYVEGNALRGPLRSEEAVRLAIQIASALETAHKHGILHRDLKPANVLITGSGAKLLDFGLARMLAPAGADLTETIEGTVLGTAAYMSPEQALGKALDERSDVFSFGAVLYEMLSGRRAFPGESMVETLSAVMHDDPSPIDALPALRRIVLHCLRKAPADRFQSMAEVKAALEQCLASPCGKLQPTIAVLPFANLSADKENEYFSDGLAEEILNLLTKVPGLKVIARTSSFAFRGKEQDIHKIAETLGVNHVLEGSVRRAGNRIRVTAQLIHADDGVLLWSERYDGEMTDVFAIQDQIGEAISEALQLRLVSRTQVVNLEAYQNYLKGHYHRVRLTPESLTKAKESYERALTIEPNYALAHSGLASYYYALTSTGIKPLGEVAAQARSAAQKALAIDPANAEAHGLLGTLAGLFDYDWESAERHFRKVLAIEPVPPFSRMRYAVFFLIPMKRLADAKEQCRLALENDPMSMTLHWGMAFSILAERQYRETIEYARRAMEIDANFYPIWLILGLAQMAADCTQEAIASYKRAVELAPWYYAVRGALAGACYRTGDREGSRANLAALSGWQLEMAEVFYYAITGEVDPMFEVLQRAYQRHDYLVVILHLSIFDPYRADPRFRSLLHGMHLA
jgi:serine/threonine-protein kinase